MYEYIQPAADTFGIIVLATWNDRLGQDTLENLKTRGVRDPDLERLDNELQQIFARFAADPDKLAIMCRCHTGTEVT